MSIQETFRLVIVECRTRYASLVQLCSCDERTTHENLPLTYGRSASDHDVWKKGLLKEVTDLFCYRERAEYFKAAVDWADVR